MVEKLKGSVFEKIKKIYGEGSIIKAKGEDPIKGIKRIPLDFISIDFILGGGLPKGRIIELYGPEASSKTTFALHAISAVQKETGKPAAFIDAEHSLNLEYAEKLGISLENLYLSQPSCGEEALEILDFLLEADLGIIVVDSVAALVPKAELDGEMGDSKMGLHARLMSQAMRKIVGKLEKSKIVLIFTNQLRMKIGCIGSETEINWVKF